MDRKRAHQKILLKQLSELEKFSSPMRLAAEEWDKPWKTLVATILSARTRDEKTIPVSHDLFRLYGRLENLAEADLKEIQKIIRPVNFYKTKSKNIKNCAKMLIERYGGRPPHDFDKLLELPGVGRKTANVFLSEMGEDAIGTDTHVLYIAEKLGWTKNDKPKDVEEDLTNLFPRKYWNKINHVLVRFGKTHTSRKEKDKILKQIYKIK